MIRYGLMRGVSFTNAWRSSVTSENAIAWLSPWLRTPVTEVRDRVLDIAARLEPRPLDRGFGGLAPSVAADLRRGFLNDQFGRPTAIPS